MKEYVEFLIRRHRATRQLLLNNGKSYRSKDVVWENGFLEACDYILDAINEPERAERLYQAIQGLAKRFK